MILMKNSGNFLEDLTRNEKGQNLESRLVSALKRLSLLEYSEKLVEYTEIYEWQKGGGETYIAAAMLGIEKGIESYERSFISKAVVTLSVDLTIKNMLRRKELLESEGVKAPKIYSVSEGCIYQELIPYSIDEAVKLGRFGDKLFDDLIFIASQVDKLGFVSLNFIGDLRTDLKDVYYTDFGFDLGEPNPGVVSDEAYNRLLRFIAQNRRFQNKEKYTEIAYRELLKI
ncbi:MAG: hypothetical protein ISS23_01010 [Nanoarchaeota archaeon]|nr:hypothetical protein [Nanoarchaeota archaeon]